MNTLLLFFALPIATIILAIVLEKILRNPILTALTFFAIYLIVAFAAFDATFLVYVIVYTLLSFISAYIAEVFYRRFRFMCHNNNTNNLGTSDNNNSENNNNNSNNNCNCRRDVVTANLTNNTTGNRSTWCCYRRN